MKKRTTGVALVLALALTATGFAQGGPPVPDGCTFELGVTTCVTVSAPYVTDIDVAAGDTFCFSTGVSYQWTPIDADSYLTLRGGYDRTTTEYRGVSDVVKNEDVLFVTTSIQGNGRSSLLPVGVCL